METTATTSLCLDLNIGRKDISRSGICWSADNRLAICSDSTVEIVRLDSGLHGESKLKSEREYINIHDDRQYLSVALSINDVVTCDASWVELGLDPAMKDRSEHSSRGFRMAAWSPLGCACNGGCLIATLTKDYEVAIYERVAQYHAPPWEKIAIVSDVLIKTLPNLLFDKKSEVSFAEFKRRRMCLASKCIAWSPISHDGSHIILAIGARSGHVHFVRLDLPLKGCALQANVSYAGGLKLSGDDEDEEVRKLAWEGDQLAVAFAKGRIDIYTVVDKGPSESQKSQLVLEHSADVARMDGREPEALKWRRMEGAELALAYGRSLQLGIWWPRGSFAAPASHCYHIADIAWLNDNRLVTASGDGIFRYFRVVSRGQNVSITLECQQRSPRTAAKRPKPSEATFVPALTVSSNAAFMAFVEAVPKTSVEARLYVTLVIGENDANRAMEFAIRDKASQYTWWDLVEYARQTSIDNAERETLRKWRTNVKNRIDSVHGKSAHLMQLFVCLQDALLAAEKMDGADEVQIATTEAETKSYQRFLYSLHCREMLNDWLKNNGDRVHDDREKHAILMLAKQLLNSGTLYPDVARSNLDLAEKVYKKLHTQFKAVVNEELTLIKNLRQLYAKGSSADQVLREKSNSTGHEVCPLCSTQVSFKDNGNAQCQDGHPWSRCRISLLLVLTNYNRICPRCSATALVKLPDSSGDGHNWLNSALLKCKECPACGSFFERVFFEKPKAPPPPSNILPSITL